MKIRRADKQCFDAVMAHYGLDADEIRLCKTAYQQDPDAARRTYAALFQEIPTTPRVLPWVPFGPVL